MAFFLIITGLTGAILAFNHEIDEWLNTDWYHVQPVNKPIISLEKINEIVGQKYPNHRVDFIDLDRAPDQSYVVRIGSMGGNTENGGSEINQIFVNPYTGAVLGGRESGAFDLSRRGIMPFLFKFHYTLHMPDKWGRWLLGGIAIIWLLDSFIGFYLTLPKHIHFNNKIDYLRRWSPAWKIKTGKAARVNYDIHRASGLWLWPVLFVTAFSSIYFNLNKEVYRPVLSLITTFSVHPSDALPKVEPKTPLINLDAALQRGLELRSPAAKNLPVSYLSYSQKQNLYRLSFDERNPNSWFKYKREQVFFDGDTGELKAIWGHSNGTAGDRFNSWQYPLHSGQMFGLPGRILILVSGLLTVGLSITGVIIWYRKGIKNRN